MWMRIQLSTLLLAVATTFVFAYVLPPAVLGWAGFPFALAAIVSMVYEVIQERKQTP